jgi:hypothetical protein
MMTRGSTADAESHGRACAAPHGLLAMGPRAIEMTWQGPPSVAWIDLRLGTDDATRLRIADSLACTPDQLTPATLARVLVGVAPDAVVATIADGRDIEACLRDASERSLGLGRLPAIAPVISDVEGTSVPGPGAVARPRPEHARRCDIWTFLAIRSRIRGNAFVKASEPYLTATDLGAAAYVRVPPDWHGKKT